ncbi:sigma-70 family RNA polymerase sigma factor [Apilactobacillus timberlakei]|uniref:sigma factor n=1 Tax=Apilactobacillus timberlakei TaxID=2008380 RepID=UPI001125F0CE|nr:sigma factor [Apilactobacillus timberlakei]TPR22424.1 sigma-70 family RNA polymerase sigma factor [Apilactobacillus timberlakei]
MNNCLIDLQLIKNFKSGHDEYFDELFIKYKPIVKKLWGQYYFNDIDEDDWFQESRITMLKIIDKFDINRGTSFGMLYKRSLKNRLFDILRKSKAKKRMPIDKKVSFNVNEEYYSNCVEDCRRLNPEFSLKMDAVRKKLVTRCSMFEKELLFKMSSSKLESDDYQLVKFKQINKINDEQFRNCCSRIKNKLKIILVEEGILKDDRKIDD